MNNPLQIFYFIAYVFSGILVVQLILNLMGFGHDAGMDAGGMDADSVPDVPADDMGVDHPDIGEHSSGLGMLSVRSVIAFFVGFGWTGVVMLSQKSSVITAVFTATGVGFIFLLIVFWLMKAIYGLSESGNVDITQAANKTGTVYVTIPKREQGTGLIQVVVQGRLRELVAITDEEEPLPTGTPIRVLKVVAENTMLVRHIRPGD